MKAKKTLTLILCMVLVAALSVAGTLAYLTSTDAVKNTFTMGHVEIKLEETDVDRLGAETGKGKQSEGNAYYLLPGHEYVKDPTVTVLSPSSDCYVRMMVTVSLANAMDDTTEALDLTAILSGYDASKWIRANKTVSADKKTITYEYRYFETVNAESGDKELEPLFTKLTVPTTWNNAELAKLSGLTVDVVAHAIQADGFTVDQAWTAFGNQHP